MIPSCHLMDYTEAPPSAVSAPYTRTKAAQEPVETWLILVSSGTGGNCSLHFFCDRYGYRPFPIIERKSIVEGEMTKPFARLMTEIKGAFGRTMTRLPTVFGVSRQTLYNWLEGETPKEAHQSKLVELAEAARVFAAAGFKPTAAHLDRTVSGGKSFLNLLADGGDGAAAARSLIRIVERSLVSRARLRSALADLPAARPDPSDIGAPAVEEDA